MEYLKMIQVDQTVLLVASVAISASIFFVFWRQFRRHLESRKPFENLPMPNPSHWLLGHIPVLQELFRDTDSSNSFEGAIECCNEHGQIGLWGVSGARAVVLTHFEDARTVLSAEYYRRMPYLFGKHLQMFLGAKNIGLLQGREWKLHRSAISRSISPPSTLSESRSAMVDVAETLVSSLKRRIDEGNSASGGDPALFETKIEPLMKMLTIDIFAKTALNTDLGSCRRLEPSPIAQAFDFLLDYLGDCLSASPLALLVQSYALPTSRNRRHFKERTLLRSFLAELIKERKESKNQNMSKKDLLDNLLQAHQDVSESDRQDLTSDQTLNDTLMALLFAGYDTTSFTLTCALYCISMSPEVEKLCLEEIRSLPDCFGPKELQYCQAVVYETLRLYSPV
jgi:cytochrome P450